MSRTPHLTPAFVIGSLRYGETSRIVRLATRDAGVQSAIAKGALRPRSRFGAALRLLSEGTAHLLASRTGDLHTLVAFDVASSHTGLAADLDRFAAASALAEVLLRFVPPEAHPRLYDQAHDDIELLEQVPTEAVGVVALRAVWRVVANLGLAPELARCARDQAPLEQGPITFSLRDGGFLCRRCTANGATTQLVAADRADLVSLLLAHDGDLPLLSTRQHAAHRRLLLRWMREHLGESSLPAVEAWATAFPEDSRAPSREPATATGMAAT